MMLILAILFIVSCKNETKKVEAPKELNQEEIVHSKFAIEILDDEALDVIDPKATIKELANGFTWTEGPLWVEDGKYLLFSDIPNNKVFKLDSENNVSVYLHPSGYTGDDSKENKPGSNGLTLDPNRNLVLLQHGDRRVAKMLAPLNNPKSEFETLADNFEGNRLNSPNDGFFDKKGNFYFTDPSYGLPNREKNPEKELGFHGVYCLLNTGEVLLLDTLSWPNGITLSPDESKLYVAVSDEKHAVWYQYDITSPGIITNKQIFYDVTHLANKEGHQGLPDGMKANKKGYLFATGPGGVWIFNTSTKKPLARIYTGQLTSNCALSDDGKKLFLTADDYILSVDLK